MRRFFSFLSCLVSLSAYGAPSALILTPEQVGRMVLDQSEWAKQIDADADLSRLSYASIIKKYDFTLSFDTGYQKSKMEEPLFFFLADEDQSYLTSLSLKKSFSTGTDLTLDVGRNSVRYDLFPSETVLVPPQYTQDFAGITLKQSLWRNFFGMADRSGLRAAEKSFQSAQVAREENLQQLVLNALKAYWKTYVAQETFEMSLHERERYQKLVESVHRKTQFGYASSGELPRAQAELEVRNQNVKLASADYLSALDSLVTLLNIPAGTEVHFKAIEQIPLPPKTSTAVDTLNLRSVRTVSLNKEAAENLYEEAKSRSGADISVVGKVYSSGLAQTSSSADSEFFSGTRPLYYVGLHYEYTFGSGYNEEEILNKKLALNSQSAQLNRVKRETEDSIANQERLLRADYDAAISSRNQIQLYDKAVIELNHAYLQGRIDISILIDATNRLVESKTVAIQKLGDYQVALNQWAALRDELIPEKQTSEASYFDKPRSLDHD